MLMVSTPTSHTLVMVIEQLSNYWLDNLEEGDDLFSLDSITKQVVSDSGSDDGESGKSVFENDEIFSLPDPELNNTTIVLPPVNLCSTSSSFVVNLPKSSAFVDWMHFVDSSQAHIFDIGDVGPFHSQTDLMLLLQQTTNNIAAFETKYQTEGFHLKNG